MSERPIAGRIWAGWLRVTASITAEQDFEFVGGIIHEAVYFEFASEHPGHGDKVDLSVRLCEEPVEEGGKAVMYFPAVVTVFDPDLDVGDALSLVAGMVRETINGWYERPEDYIVCFAANGECREILG